MDEEKRERERRYSLFSSHAQFKVTSFRTGGSKRKCEKRAVFVSWLLPGGEGMRSLPRVSTWSLFGAGICHNHNTTSHGHHQTSSLLAEPTAERNNAKYVVPTWWKMRAINLGERNKIFFSQQVFFPLFKSNLIRGNLRRRQPQGGWHEWGWGGGVGAKWREKGIQSSSWRGGLNPVAAQIISDRFRANPRFSCQRQTLLNYGRAQKYGNSKGEALNGLAPNSLFVYLFLFQKICSAKCKAFLF